MNALHIGSANRSDLHRSVPSTYMEIDVAYPRFNINATINASVSIGDVILEGGSELYYDTHKLRVLTLSRLLTREACSAVPASVLNFYNLSSDIGLLDVDINVTLFSSDIDPSPLRVQFNSSGTNRIPFSVVASVLSRSFASAEDMMNGLSRMLLPNAGDKCQAAGINPNADHRSGKSEFDDENVMMHWNRIFLLVAFVALQTAAVAAIHRLGRWNDQSDTG